MKNFEFFVIVLSLSEIYAEDTVKLIPIPEALTFGPKTHERLIVPVEPINENSNLIPIPEALTFGPKTHERIIVPIEPPPIIKKEPIKPNIVLRRPIEIQAPSKVKLVVENPTSRRTNYVPQNQYHNARNALKPQEIQPLHVTMRGLPQSKPNHTRESVQEKRQRFKNQEERIKMKNLPPNPTEVPKTTWFDNLGKYNYGIVHDFKYEDLPTLEEITDTAGGESKEVTQPPVVMTSHRPEIKFRSSFRDPTIYATLHSENDNMGKFLYNTQIFYPNYRDHIYSPVTTFYGPHHVLPNDLPVFNVHRVVHEQPKPNNVEQPKIVNNARKHQPPKKSPPVINKKSLPVKPHTPKQEPPKKLPPPPPKEEPKETEEDYDYEEDDTEDDDYDEGSNDKYLGNSSDDDEEEESSNESDGKGKKSYKSNNSDESEESEDQFDQAWGKFGYGKNKASSESDSDSYESSESQNQPKRVKIVHMKMEVQTTPFKDSNSDVEEVETPELENKKNKKKDVNGNNQKPHPNAGPDDLKYFQYMNYLGNGEHRAGGRFGNDNHYVEQHERGNKNLGVFQKKVKWADKEGGFGEHYWDLNHG